LSSSACDIDRFTFFLPLSKSIHTHTSAAGEKRKEEEEELYWSRVVDVTRASQAAGVSID
jgi:hypothetical protein